MEAQPPPVTPVQPPTKICPHCAAQAQTLEKRCPNCGKRYKKRTFLKVTLILALIGLVLIAGCSALIAGVATETEKAIDEEINANAITTRQFRAVELGTSQRAVERKLGPPENKQEFEQEGVLPGDEPSGSSCTYYNEQGSELFEGNLFQFCFDDGRLTSKNSY